MLHIQIICIGKIKEKYFTQAIEEYKKRIVGGFDLTIKELSEYKLQDNTDIVVQKEGESILPLMKGAYNIAMCIEGKQVSSEKLWDMMQRVTLNGDSRINFIIGGSYGLSDAVKAAADFKLSVSPMTFPHQLFRVMLCEQIYRATQIGQGTKYHK